MSTAEQLVADLCIRRKATAVHESGHAVACLVFDLHLQETTIERSVTTDRHGWEMYAGLTRFQYAEEKEAHLCAIACLAGPAASAHFCPDGYQPGMEGDFADCEKAIDKATGDSRSFTIGAYASRRADIAVRVKRVASQLVVTYWSEIVSVANGLMVFQTLAGDAARRIFERSARERGMRPEGFRVSCFSSR